MKASPTRAQQHAFPSAASVATFAPLKPATQARTAHFDPASSRAELIAAAAYYRAEKRGFAPGHDVEDWLAAEREVDGLGQLSPAPG